uniref:sterol desaturase family protein n=1 Tax=Mariniflexile sp. TaxID=1979402 RepID=UPI00404877B2
MDFLSNNDALLQLAIYGGTLLLFWIVELYISTQKLNLKVLHTALNGKFLVFVLPVQIILSLVVFSVSNWTEVSNWGLLHLFPIETNSILFFVVAFIILDFFDYGYHFMMHKTPFFWRFHQVHHSDMEVDITTTIREHPGETFIRVSYSILIIAMVGASPWVLIAKQFIQSVSNLASHTNIKLPDKVNAIISLVFVTPNTHHIHHHYKLPYTDSNYGDVLTIWDRLFSTFSKMKQSDIVFGVDTHMDELENKDFKNLITRPFESTVPTEIKVIQLNPTIHE